MLRSTLFFGMGAMLATSLAPGNSLPINPSDHPVKLYDDGVMVRVPVRAFGRTLYFLLDTGCTLSAIDSKYQSYLGKAVEEFNAETPLGSKTVDSFNQCPEISLAGKPLGLRNITSLDLEMARRVSGQPCDGILGMDFLEKHVIQIEFDNQSVAVITIVPDVVKKTFIPIPLKHVADHYLVEVSANGVGPIDLMVDTGDNSSISLNAESWKQVFPDGNAQALGATVAGIGSQTAQSKIEILNRLAVGSLTYTNLHTTFIRNPADPSHLGLGFFRRHSVVFDFPHQMLYLEPGQRFPIPDKEDMSGLHLLRQEDATVVYSVDENSPAAIQGIEPGDIIEVIDGQKTSALSMRAIRRMLKSHDGDSITLETKRGNYLSQINLTLKQIL